MSRAKRKVIHMGSVHAGPADPLMGDQPLLNADLIDAANRLCHAARIVRIAASVPDNNGAVNRSLQLVERESSRLSLLLSVAK